MTSNNNKKSSNITWFFSTVTVNIITLTFGSRIFLKTFLKYATNEKEN